MKPADWDAIDEGIKAAMRLIEALAAPGTLTEREQANTWRVLEALNHARAVAFDGRKLCEQPAL